MEPSFLNSIAVIDGDRVIDYGELTARTNVLARELIGLGVGPEMPVAVSVPRSVEMVIAAHAVVAAGGHFVPVGVDAPAERVRYILEVTGADVLVVSAHAREAADRVDLGAVRVVEVDASAVLVGDGSTITDADRTAPLLPDHPMYTIFTSGSTGTPKGVTVSRRTVMAMLRADQEQYGFSSADVVLAVLDFTFDPSVLDLFRPVLCGGSVVLAGPGEQRDPWALRDYVVRHGVTSVMMVPSMLSLVLSELSAEDLRAMSTLRTIQVGGEALPPALADEVYRVWPHVNLQNQYGPTETIIYSTIAEVGSGVPTVPIGVPTPHTVAQVLDSRLRPVPMGVSGELYLGGGQMARGYIGRPGLTAERFVADPFGKPGARLYRTGDVVRWRADGQLEYLGRVDFQVKLRGQRIELGEIESVIASAPGVHEVAVTVVDTPAGSQNLVAYVTGDDEVTHGVLRAYAAEHLLPFMRPSVWVVLDDMPVNAAGKVDRKALPAPVFDAMEYVAPESEAEQSVAAVFVDLLGVERVSVVESFFDLGGNSLSAARLAARVSAVLGVQVSVRDIFDAPSVRELVIAAADAAPAMPPVTAVSPRPERVPLSFAQQRMWFINQLEPEAPTYNMPIGVRLKGSLDVPALRSAVADVVERHEILRTTFPSVDGEPFQLVHSADSSVAEPDWAVVSDEGELVAAAGTGFDVAAAPPFRVRLMKVSDTEHVLLAVLHHLVGDGESMRPLIGDIVGAYLARTAGVDPGFDPLEVQFADYALWQREVLGSPDDPASVVGRQLEYWQRQLAGAPDVLELPLDRPRPTVASHHGAVVSVPLPPELGVRLDALARERGVTRFMVVHAALAVLLSRLSGTDDISIATPIAGRGQQVLEPLVGMFVNTLVLRTPVRSRDRFVDFLDKVRGVDLEAFTHADVPFEAVVERVRPVRSQAFAPLAQVTLSVPEQDGARSGDGALVVGGLEVESLHPPVVPAHNDLSITLASGGVGEGEVGVTYAVDLFDESTVHDLAERFVRALTAVTEDPARRVGEIPIMTVDELPRLREWSRGWEGGSVPETLGEPWRETGQQSVGAVLSSSTDQEVRPGAASGLGDSYDRPAIISGGEFVSRGEFDFRVAALAHELIDLGVGPEVAVGIQMARSVEQVVAIHAVVQAGGHFVPLDRQLPVDRLRYMAQTAQVRLVLVTAGQEVEARSRFDGLAEVHVVGEPHPNEAGIVDGVESVASVRGENAAFTLFTSGSTGQPKAVVITHRGVANRLYADIDQYDLTARDVFLYKAPITFDVAVREIFLPIKIGATMVIADEGRHGDPGHLADLISRYEVTVVHFVPAMLAVFNEVLGPQVTDLTSLRLLQTGGEALTAPTARELMYQLPGVRVRNQYGPAETSIDVTCYRVGIDDRVIPLGTPTRNVNAYVLDENLNEVPVGVPGELYVGGVQLARGYASRADLTAERFVADPFGGPGARLYRTGDRARWNRDGHLEYLGRTDFQVKLRGQRLELGEVESAVSGAPGVVHAAARVVSGPAGDQLVGYVAPASVDVDVVRASVAGSLPEYMRPSVWVVLEEMPLNSAGKVDRRSLPDPELGVAEYVAPGSETEEVVAGVFADLLGVERVSVVESFFDLGGNSLLAVQVVARVRQRGLPCELKWLFSDPTIRELGRRIDGDGELRNDVLITLRADGARLPIFCVHPAGGLAWFYGALAQYLADRPIYGLQDPHVVNGEPSATDVDELAERYVNEIRRVQPNGPYHILGWSIGGTIAFAMATRLQADGEQVAYLGVMDSMLLTTGGAPLAARGLEEDGQRAGITDHAADLLGGWRDLFDLDEAITAETSEEVASIVRSQIAKIGLLEEDVVDRVMDSFEAAPRLSMQFQPQPFHGRVQVFTATSDKEDPTVVAESWRAHVSGGVENVDVATHHLGMADSAAMAVIGPRIEQALSETEDPGHGNADKTFQSGTVQT
ncbi:amino acid adenylation domain-containing protein [Gordonia paraffinivorans]|uniref:amino acid adenylation domain-containing protein n=1 Tax=Gordonia paraffinivorans TaxID=175628 RepID=UPI0003468215|nr:non-ribosomal peptide synthetase [Gordonia paraffinivorans]